MTESPKQWATHFESEVAEFVIEPVCKEILRNGGATSLIDLHNQFRAVTNTKTTLPQFKKWLPHMPTVGPLFGAGRVTLPFEPEVTLAQESRPAVIDPHEPIPSGLAELMAEEELLEEERTPTQPLQLAKERPESPVKQIMPPPGDNAPPLPEDVKKKHFTTTVNNPIPGLHGPTQRPNQPPPQQHPYGQPTYPGSPPQT